MNIKNLHPEFSASEADSSFQIILRNALMRTNFIPGIRYKIGWRGIKDSSLDVEGWSAKIDGMSGVFGIFFDSSIKDRNWTTGKFILNYFPSPEEELVELFSIQAGIQSQQKDYLSKIRNFLQFPELCDLFNIGIINLSINKNQDTFSINLESLSKQRIIAEDGVSLTKDNNIVELVKPGGCDQDLPSYDVAYKFFRVLAATITFNLEDSPVSFLFGDASGSEIIYDSQGNSRERKSDYAKKKFIELIYKNNNKIDRSAKKPKNIKLNNETITSWIKGEDIITEYSEELWWKAHKMKTFKSLDKNILGIDDRPELIIVSGFLGAGKTSFLQNFIEYQVGMNRFVAVIQNEIGEVGLDGKLLDQNYAVTEIDEGCICCTLVGNLKSAINEILSEFHPDYIILETSGLANPYNLLDEIDELKEVVRFDSVTTIVDALNIIETIENYAIAENQIKAADLILLNKEDLLEKDDFNKVKEKIKLINSVAPMVITQYGNVNPTLLYGNRLEEEKRQAITSIKENPKDKNHILTQNKHFHSHEHDSLSSISIEMKKPVNQDKFIKALENLSDKIFRVKGVVEFDNISKPMLVQFVAGRYEISEYNNPEFKERFLIIIGQDLSKVVTEDTFKF